jgi:hypothetical protein
MDIISGNESNYRKQEVPCLMDKFTTKGKEKKNCFQEAIGHS